MSYGMISRMSSLVLVEQSSNENMRVHAVGVNWNFVVQGRFYKIVLLLLYLQHCDGYNSYYLRKGDIWFIHNIVNIMFL